VDYGIETWIMARIWDAAQDEFILQQEAQSKQLLSQHERILHELEALKRPGRADEETYERFTSGWDPAMTLPSGSVTQSTGQFTRSTGQFTDEEFPQAFAEPPQGEGGEEGYWKEGFGPTEAKIAEEDFQR
jgi:hypothetical protein